MRGTEWLDGNSGRAYPFREDSDMSVVGGVVSVLPNSFLLDMRVVSTGRRPGDARLLAASVSGDSVSATLSIGGGLFEISGKAGGRSVVRDGTLSVSAAFGEHGLPDGFYRMARPPSILCTRVVALPFSAGIDRIVCGGVAAHGDIHVANGRNTELNIVGGRLRLDIGRGLGLGMPCDGDPAVGMPCGRRPVLYLNGQKADSDGNMGIFGGEGVSVSSGEYGGIPAVVVRESAEIGNRLHASGVSGTLDTFDTSGTSGTSGTSDAQQTGGSSNG